MRSVSLWLEGGLVVLSLTLLATGVLAASWLESWPTGVTEILWSPWTIGVTAFAAILSFSRRRHQEPQRQRTSFERLTQIVAYLILLIVLALSVAPVLENRK